MTDPTPGLIVQPPRAFQYSAIFVFENDARSDEQLQLAVMRAVSIASDLAATKVRQIGVPRVAVPIQGTPT